MEQKRIELFDNPEFKKIQKEMESENNENALKGCLIFIVVVGLLIALFKTCSSNDENEYAISNSDSAVVTAFDEGLNTEEIKPNRVVDDNARFLIDNGMNPNADLTEEQMKEVKELIEYGTFSKISFCQAFNDFLPMDNAESEEYLNKFELPKGKTTKNLAVILSFYGHQLCK